MGVSIKNQDFQRSFSQNQVNAMFIDDFIQNTHPDVVIQNMEYHPNYLEKFISIQNCLLIEDGPLPYDYRHYIAIIASKIEMEMFRTEWFESFDKIQKVGNTGIFCSKHGRVCGNEEADKLARIAPASSRHRCGCLVNLHEREFILHGGNPEWLKGIKHAPHKLQDLNEINKILAHQPWLITKNHMTKLLRSSEPWSLSELMHAIILLVHVHSLCSFVYGCDFSNQLADNCFLGNSTGGSDSDNDCSSDVEDDCLSINHRNEQASSKEASVELEMFKNGIRNLTTSMQDIKSEELIELFICLAIQNEESIITNVERSSGKLEIPHFEKGDDFTYTDFATRDSVNLVPTFRASDYTWDDHGFSLVNRLYPDIGNLLDDKYTMAADMISHKIGDHYRMDTSAYGQAIRNYIHSLFGIRHDDYDYSKINQLLERHLKTFIKTCTCYPERLQNNDYDGSMRDFTHSDKVHLNLILMEARQLAELLYALRALNIYIT